MAMSQYEYQKFLKEKAGSLGLGGSNKAWNASETKRNGYYTKGLGWSENEPLTTTDENGQRVVQTSGLQRQGKVTADGTLSREGGDRLAKAYDTVKSGVSSLLAKWRQSRAIGDDAKETDAKDDLYQYYKTNGVYIGDRAGFDEWFARYQVDMGSETMPVSALMNSKGVATKTSDGRLTSAGVSRENAQALSGGGTSGSVWQKKFQPSAGSWI